MDYFAHSQTEFRYKYVVMMTDTDQFKHMSFANYLKLMFLASDALLAPFYEDNAVDRYKFNLLSSRMQFKRQTVISDSILVKINSTKIDGADFSLLYTFVMEGTGEIVALGRSSSELIDLSCKEKCAIPDALLKVLQQIYCDEEHLLYKY